MILSWNFTKFWIFVLIQNGYLNKIKFDLRHNGGGGELIKKKAFVRNYKLDVTQDVHEWLLDGSLCTLDNLIQNVPLCVDQKSKMSASARQKFDIRSYVKNKQNYWLD